MPEGLVARSRVSSRPFEREDCHDAPASHPRRPWVAGGRHGSRNSCPCGDRRSSLDRVQSQRGSGGPVGRTSTSTRSPEHGGDRPGGRGHRGGREVPERGRLPDRDPAGADEGAGRSLVAGADDFVRRAFANVYSPTANRTIEVVVDLRTSNVVSWTNRAGVQPAIYASEYDIGDQIVQADARFKRAMRDRGIDPKDVYVDLWAPGDHPDPPPTDAVRGSCAASRSTETTCRMCTTGRSRA